MDDGGVVDNDGSVSDDDDNGDDFGVDDSDNDCSGASCMVPELCLFTFVDEGVVVVIDGDNFDNEDGDEVIDDDGVANDDREVIDFAADRSADNSFSDGDVGDNGSSFIDDNVDDDGNPENNDGADGSGGNQMWDFHFALTLSSMLVTSVPDIFWHEA